MNDHTLLLFVKPEKIQQCIVDVQRSLHGGNLRSRVRDCFYLKEDRLFAVMVGMDTPYPFLETDWKEKWDVGYTRRKRK